MFTVYIKDEYGRKKEYGYVRDNEVCTSGTGLFFSDTRVGIYKVYDDYAEVYVGGEGFLKGPDAKIYPNGAMYKPGRRFLDDEIRIGRIYESGNIYLGSSEDTEELVASMDVSDDVYETCAAYLLLFYF